MRKKIFCFLLFVAMLFTSACSFGSILAEESKEPTESPIPENPYGPSDFAYDGDYLTCQAGESILGIDVSEWQGEIDWQQVAQAGVEFVLIRAAWRGTDEGGLNPDTRAQSNYEGAKAAGLKVGAYIFSQAISPTEAEEEAQYLLEQVKDWELDMPLIMDWEYVDKAARTGRVRARLLTDCILRFCRVIEDAGYEPMVYFNLAQVVERMYLRELVDYKFWLAMYDAPMNFPYQIDMWQYTDSGTVPGISTPVDMNLYFIYEEPSI